MCWHMLLPRTYQKSWWRQRLFLYVQTFNIIKKWETLPPTLSIVYNGHETTVHTSLLLYWCLCTNTTIIISDDVLVYAWQYKCLAYKHSSSRDIHTTCVCVYVISLSNILRFVYDFISQFISGTDADKLYNQMYSDWLWIFFYIYILLYYSWSMCIQK